MIACLGADADVVTDAVGLDSRIGRKYLKGASGYGGPCFPRDNVAFGYLARSVGARADLAEATDRINRYRSVASWTRAVFAPGSTKGATIGSPAGLPYKPETGVIEESQGVDARSAPCRRGISRVGIFDPLAMPARLGGPRQQGLSCRVGRGVRRIERLVVDHDAVAAVSEPPGQLPSPGRAGTPFVVIDCWRVLTAKEEIQSVAEVVYLGFGDHQSATPATETKTQSRLRPLARGEPILGTPQAAKCK